ncbi:MAG: Bug family tripartite tricarboxylate transporter substrate binding protein [Lautropia sp.]
MNTNPDDKERPGTSTRHRLVGSSRERRALMRALGGLAAALGASGAANPARAQRFPSRPIRLVVPYATGGAPDILARVLSSELGERLGATIVENRPGAGGSLGADLVAKSTPDGHTILLTTTATQSINPALYPSIPYDPLRDFTAISFVAYTPIVLVAANTVPATDLRRLVEWLKARPGEVAYASAGVGTMQHITAKLFEAAAGVDMQHVPYKGTSQLIPDLVSGRVPVMFNSVGAMLPSLKEGKLRAIGVASARRLDILPDVPTLDESGMQGFEASAWYGIFGPRGVPPAIVERIDDVVGQVLALPAVRARLDALALAPARMTPEQFSQLTARDLAKWSKVIHDKGIRAE